MISQVYYSDCCGADTLAAIADEGTAYWTCSNCGKPCTALEHKPKIKKPKSSVWDKGHKGDFSLDDAGIVDTSMADPKQRKWVFDSARAIDKEIGESMTKPTPDWEKDLSDAFYEIMDFEGDIPSVKAIRIARNIIHQVEQEARKDSQASLLERVNEAVNSVEQFIYYAKDKFPEGGRKCIDVVELKIALAKLKRG